MVLRNIFKKRKSREEEIKPKKESKEVKNEKTVKTLIPKAKKETKVSEAYRILKFPHITEKATNLVGKNQYVFRVWENSNKAEIKKTIEKLYGVEVVSVRIINIPAKRRRLGKIFGWRKKYKKAIVKIKEGQKIEVLPR